MSDLNDPASPRDNAIVEPLNGSTARLVWNAIASYMSAGLSGMAGFVVTPILLACLGSERFGVWTIVTCAIAYLALLDFGLFTTVSKRVAGYLAHGDEAHLNELLSTAYILYAMLSLAALSAMGAMVYLANIVFHLGGDNQRAAQYCLVILGLNQVLVFFFAPSTAILFGAGRLDRVALVTSVVSPLGAIGSAIVVLRGHGIASLAAITVGTTLLGGMATTWFMKRAFPFISPWPWHATIRMGRELLKFGSRNWLLSLAGNVSYGSDALIVGAMLPAANVANYVIGAKLVSVVNMIAAKPISVLMPAYSHSDAKGDLGRQFRLYTESVNVSMTICVPFVAAICIFGRRLVTAWVGPGHDTSYPVCVVLSLALLFLLPGHACSSILVATERNGLLVRLYLAGAAVNLMLSVWLTRSLGIIGAALGSLITVMIVDFGILPLVVSHAFGFSYREYLRRALRPILIPGSVAVVVAYILEMSHLSSGRLVTICMLAGVVGVCWASWLLTGRGTMRAQRYFGALRAALGMHKRIVSRPLPVV